MDTEVEPRASSFLHLFYPLPFFSSHFSALPSEYLFQYVYFTSIRSCRFEDGVYFWFCCFIWVSIE